MEELSLSAYNAYRGLVYETEGFERYFWASTVITEIASLNIGSRPASRKKTTAIGDLRAIPWVFSWAQCRLMLPGWFGFGSAVKAYIDAHPKDGLDALKGMYANWPFFRTLLSNMDMVLAKSSLAIASRYARLVEDVPLREKIFARISREWRNSVDALNAIMEQSKLLESNPLLDRSIRNRFPYLDPLNHVQVELLQAAPIEAGGERKGADRNPAHHQRHIGGPAKQRVTFEHLTHTQFIAVSTPAAAVVSEADQFFGCSFSVSPAGFSVVLRRARRRLAARRGCGSGAGGGRESTMTRP